MWGPILYPCQGGVKRGMQVLASGAPEADRLLAGLPVAVWLIHGVHGNEISSSDAALP